MRWLWVPLAVLGLLLAGLAVWNWLLSREIRRRKKAERDLRASEERFKTVMDNLPIGIAVNSVDPVVRFEYMNDNFPRFYRTTREALAKPDAFWDAVYEDPEFREEIRRRVLEAMSSGDPKRMRWEDVPIVRRGEPTTYITAQNTPLPDEGLAISTVWDVTERKTAEEAVRRSDERLRRFVEANVVGVVLADTTGRDPGGQRLLSAAHRIYARGAPAGVGRLAGPHAARMAFGRREGDRRTAGVGIERALREGISPEGRDAGFGPPLQCHASGPG